MTTAAVPHHWARSASYWVQWLLLELFGPATQDEATDPIAALKRKYGRPRGR